MTHPFLECCFSVAMQQLKSNNKTGEIFTGNLVWSKTYPRKLECIYKICNNIIKIFYAIFFSCLSIADFYLF